MESVIFSGELSIIWNVFKDSISMNYSDVRRLIIDHGWFDSIDLSDSIIRGKLCLGGEKNSRITWKPHSQLILRNTSVSSLSDCLDCWPSKIELNGLKYAHFAGLGGENSNYIADRDLSWLKSWIGKQESYSPQPYEQLAKVLKEIGSENKAKEILYEMNERELSFATGLKWVWLFLHKVFIGYGYYNFWSLYWTLGFIMFGYLIVSIGRHQKLKSFQRRLIYSIDLFLPIIKLDERNYDIHLGSIEYYFIFHQIMGYVVASFLIAGLAGLTK